MASPVFPSSYIAPCNIKSDKPGKGYWQCGMWVADQKDATVYPNEEEAAQVRLLRRLIFTTIVSV